MTDNEFWTKLFTILSPLAISIEPNLVLVGGFMPNTQGAPENPVSAFHIISTKRYGFQGSADVYNSIDEDFDHTESWILERTIQVGAMVKLDPENLAQITAFDIVNSLSALLQSESVVLQLKGELISILRITDIRETFVDDESAQHTENPSFDFTVTYTNSFDTKIPQVIESHDTILRV